MRSRDQTLRDFSLLKTGTPVCALLPAQGLMLRKALGVQSYLESFCAKPLTYVRD